MDYKAIIKNLVIKIAFGLSGLRAWIASIGFNILWARVIQPIINYLKVKKEVDDATKKYDEVIKDPNANADDIRNAFDDLNKH